MNRLTKRDGKGRAYFDDDGSLIRGANGSFHQKKDMTAHYIHDRFVALDKAIDRLAAYEDAMPLERAQELARVEEDVRLIVSPCKIGQEVFYLDEGFRSEICPAIVVGIEINGHTPQCQMWLRIKYTSQVIGSHEYFCRADMMLGRTVFLTREEAEAALKKREEADDEAD